MAQGLVAQMARQLQADGLWQGALPPLVREGDGVLLAALRAEPDPFLQVLLHEAGLGGEGADAPADLLAAWQAPQQNAMEKGLAVAWLDRVGRAEAAASVPVTPQDQAEGQWLQGTAPGDAGTWSSTWYWQGTSVPDGLELRWDRPLPTTRHLQLDYASAQPPRGGADAPVRIERRLLRLVPGKEAFQFTTEPMADGVVASDGLYLDEITVTPTRGTRLQYGMLRVPLPAGADVERTTWGMGIDGRPMTRALAEPSPMGYQVQVPQIDAPQTYRHLLRFSQTGTLALPPATYQLRYAPRQFATEAGPAVDTLVVR